MWDWSSIFSQECMVNRKLRIPGGISFAKVGKLFYVGFMVHIVLLIMYMMHQLLQYPIWFNRKSNFFCSAFGFWNN